VIDGWIKFYFLFLFRANLVLHIQYKFQFYFLFLFRAFVCVIFAGLRGLSSSMLQPSRLVVGQILEPAFLSSQADVNRMIRGTTQRASLKRCVRCNVAMYVGLRRKMAINIQNMSDLATKTE
jgi:hypothetical protein